MKFAIPRFVSVMALVSLASVAAQAAPLASAQLELPEGTWLEAIGSKTLSEKGAVAVTVDTLTRNGRVFTVTGTWAKKGFVAQTTSRADAQLLEVTLTLIQDDGGACSASHFETARLRLARAVDGQLRIVGARLDVTTNYDVCHGSDHTVSAELSPSNDGACSDSLTAYLGMSVYTRNQTTGKPLVGFSDYSGHRYDGGAVGASLVMETPSAKFFYLETCEMCADLFKCEKVTGQVASIKSAHTVGCSDLPAADRATATYINCN